MFVNRRLWGAIAPSALLQVAVVHIGLLNVAFGTTPLSADRWLPCIAMASTVLRYGESRKPVIRFTRSTTRQP